MIPVLYDSGERNFTSNGLGRLYDALSCTVTEERNGSYELEMTYPVSGMFFGKTWCCPFLRGCLAFRWEFSALMQ